MFKEFKKFASIITITLLCALIIFLPLSAWGVSYFGKQEISMIRDLLLFAMAIPSLFLLELKRKTSLFYLALFFLIYIAISYFWKEASSIQWVRGLRFIAGPILLFLLTANLELNEKSRKAVYISILVSSALILLLAICESLGMKLPLTSQASGGLALERTQFVQGLNIPRLQSVLAGPNALGLFIVAILAFFLSKLPEKSSIFIWLLPIILLVAGLTFSRSAWIGIFVILLLHSYKWVVSKYGRKLAYAWIASLLLLVTIFGSLLYTSGKKDILLHGDSSTIRLRQYSRIWETKEEIGLFGRGVGTAGPSSQYRLDQGENHYTENIYLDVYEELGVVGLAFILMIFSSFIIISARNYNHYPEARAAFLTTAAFAVSGLFINIYTGQVGIFLLWLANGMSYNRVVKLKKEHYEKNIN